MADSSDLIRLAVEAAPDAMVAVDGQGKLVIFNQAAQDIFDVAEAQVLGQPIGILSGGEALAECLGQPGGQSWLLPARDGRPALPFNINSSAVQTGRMALSIGILRHAARARSLNDRPSSKPLLPQPIPEQSLPCEGVLVLDEDGMILAANAMAEKLFGFPVAELVSQPVTLVVPLVHGTTLPASVGNFLEQDADGLPRRAEGRRKSGNRFALEIVTSPIQVAGQKAFVAVTRDPNVKDLTEEALRETEHRMAAITENLPGVVYQRVLKPDGSLLYSFVSEGCTAVMGITPEELMADPGLFISALAPSDRQSYLARLRQSAETLSLLDEELNILTRSGQMRWLHSRSKPRLLTNGDVVWDGVAFDITRMRQTEDKLAFLTQFDALTGAANRSLFMQRFTFARKAADRGERFVAVLSLGLDRFGIVNTTLGHDVGDQVLVAAAERLQSCLRAGDTLARVGGDRFLALLTNLESDQDIGAAVERILAASSHPLAINGEGLDMTACIGVARYPEDGNDGEILVKNADAALTLAKKHGPSSVQYYLPEVNSLAIKTLAMHTLLRRAVERREFIPYYQPQVDLRSGKLVGIEVLARWMSPERGMVSPADFIPVAEEFGLIDSLCEQILQDSCFQTSAWQKAGLPAVPIAVNLSGRQFHRPSQLIGMVEKVLADSGLDPSFLELEITETSAMRDPASAIAVVARLRDMGVATAIDDFGTGYSSLSVLKRFPIRKLKIDRSFIVPVGNLDDPNAVNDEAIVEAIIAMAHAMGLQVVAEGVEEQRHLDFLRRAGCEVMQGYFFSRPLDAAGMEALLREGRGLDPA